MNNSEFGISICAAEYEVRQVGITQDFTMWRGERPNGSHYWEFVTRPTPPNDCDGTVHGTNETNSVSRQLFLNLFALWFNLHPFGRGPRKGKSPYELAGIDLGTEDWLTLLGFPPD
jgi:hypothetical protein